MVEPGVAACLDTLKPLAASNEALKINFEPLACIVDMFMLPILVQIVVGIMQKPQAFWLSHYLLAIIAELVAARCLFVTS